MHAPHAGGCMRWVGPPNGVHAGIRHCPAWHLQAHPHIPRMSPPSIFGKVVCMSLAGLGTVCIVLSTSRGAHTCPEHPILPPLIPTSPTSQDVLLRSGPPCVPQTRCDTDPSAKCRLRILNGSEPKAQEWQGNAGMHESCKYNPLVARWRAALPGGQRRQR